MKTISKVIEEIKMDTINRGVKRFIISHSKKGYFAHELGGKEKAAIIFNWQQCKAYKINGSCRRGNQYGTYWKTKPYSNIDQAKQAIVKTAFSHIRYF